MINPIRLGRERDGLKEAEFAMPVPTPFRLDLTEWAVRRRDSNIVGHWGDGRYSRLLTYRERPVRLVVRSGGALCRS